MIPSMFNLMIVLQLELKVKSSNFNQKPKTYKVEIFFLLLIDTISKGVDTRVRHKVRVCVWDCVLQCVRGDISSGIRLDAHVWWISSAGAAVHSRDKTLRCHSFCLRAKSSRETRRCVQIQEKGNESKSPGCSRCIWVDGQNKIIVSWSLFPTEQRKEK